MPSQHDQPLPSLDLNLRAQMSRSGDEWECFFRVSIESGGKDRMLSLDLQIRVIITSNGSISSELVSATPRGEGPRDSDRTATTAEKHRAKIAAVGQSLLVSVACGGDHAAAIESGGGERGAPAAANRFAASDAPEAAISPAAAAPEWDEQPHRPPSLHRTTTTEISATIKQTQTTQLVYQRLQEIGMLPATAQTLVAQHGETRVAEVIAWQDRLSTKQKIANRASHLFAVLQKGPR